MAEYQKICEVCGSAFVAKRDDAKTCLARCKKKLQRYARSIRLGLKGTKGDTQTLHDKAKAWELMFDRKVERPVESSAEAYFRTLSNKDWKQQIDSLSKRARIRAAETEGLNKILWEETQRFVLETWGWSPDYPGGEWIVFTATTASDDDGDPVRRILPDPHGLSPRKVKRAIRKLQKLQLQGMVVYEGGMVEGRKTLGDEKRFHAHGLIMAPSPEVRGLVISRMRGILGGSGFCQVEEVRDRVLWARYITKDVMVGDLKWDIIGAAPGTANSKG